MLARIRTGYSFRVAVGMPENCVKHMCDTWGHDYFPITDRASSYGWFEWEKECEKAHKTPVYGVELEVSPDLTATRPVSDLWVFYPKNNMRELNELISRAYHQFRYRPLLSVNQALEYKGFKIIGHRSDLKLLQSWNDYPNVFAGLSPSVTRYYLNRLRDLNIPLVASGDNVYPTPKHRSLYQIICTSHDERSRYKQGGLQTYPQHIMGLGEWVKYMGHAHNIARHALQKYIATTESILREASKCSLNHAKLPEYNNSEDDLSLREKTLYRSQSVLGFTVKDNDEYRERWEKELDLIKQKGFESYFHIVSDITKYARDRMIVGPGRGSAAGSLVCYLLGITTVDPIKHGLSFERFIDVHREDLPDIDIDFPTAKRAQVIRYVKKVFGHKHAAQFGTVNFYQAKQSIREACSALNIKPWDLGRIRRADNLNEALEDAEDVLQDFPEAAILRDIEGHPRHAGKHAGGVVLSQNPIVDVIPINLRERASPVAMITKKPAEKMGLLKIDILGVAELDTLKDCMDLAGVDFNLLNKVPLNYGPAYKIIQQQRYTGIFQYNEPPVQGVANRVRVSEFNDLCVITAVGRKGPLEGGAADLWCKRRNGEEDVIYSHPLFKNMLSETLGVIVYQEQLMRIMREIGDMPWAHIMVLRKAINDKDTEIFNEYRDEFVAGCLKNGLDEVLAHSVYDELSLHGEYSFNKSHAVSYSLLTYWCMVLKSRFPLEFTAAALTNMRGTTKEIKLNKQRTLLKEAKGLGVDFVPVDIEISTDKWQIDKKRNALVGPLDNIAGIGPKKMKSILHHRKMNKVMPAGLVKLISKGKPELDSLYPLKDNLDRLCGEEGLNKFNIHVRTRTIEDIKSINIPPDEEIGLVCFIDKIKIKYEKDKGVTRRRLVLHVHDDTDKMYATVNARYYNFVNNTLNKQGLKSSSSKKQNIYALKGNIYNVSRETKLMSVIAVRYIGASV